MDISLLPETYKPPKNKEEIRLKNLLRPKIKMIWDDEIID